MAREHDRWAVWRRVEPDVESPMDPGRRRRRHLRPEDFPAQPLRRWWQV